MRNRLIALGASACLALLVACGSTGQGGDQSAPISFYGTNTLSQWDPTKSAIQAADVPYFTQVYDRLLQLRGDNSIEPALAQSWTFGDGDRTLTMKLRTDVVFQDGGRFDAANAVANLNRNRATGSILAPSLTGIADVSAVGPDELRISLSKADPTILYRLASTSSSMVSPAGLANVPGLATQPAGSGPFRLVGSDGTTVTLARNDGYWNTSAVYPPTKTISAVFDDAARLNAVRSGTASIATARPSQWLEVQRLVEAGQAETLQFGEMGQYVLYMNAKSGPLSNPVVRKAISQAMDRATISKALLNDLCMPSSQVVPKGFAGHDDSSPDADTFDPAAARKSLADAGVGPITLSTVVYDSGLFAQLGEVAKEQLAAIGVTLDLRPMPATSATPEWRSGKYDMFVLQITPSTPDMINIIDNDYLGPGGVGADLPQLRQMTEAARPLALGSPERAEALRQISAMLFREPVHVPLCQVPGVYVFQPGLQGVADIPGHLLSANVPDSRSLRWKTS